MLISDTPSPLPQVHEHFHLDMGADCGGYGVCYADGLLSRAGSYGG